MTEEQYRAAMSAPIKRSPPKPIATRPALWRRIVWRVREVVCAIFPVSP
jgi:hypothetical protein